MLSFQRVLLALIVFVASGFQYLLGAAEVEKEEAVRSGYLRAGDILQVTVFRHPDLSMHVRVDPDDSFLFPQCGLVNVKGKMPGEVAGVLKDRLSEADIPNPEVVVFVERYSPRYVYVLGEVKGEVEKALKVEPGSTMTALQAISAVGGFADTADLRNVFVRRSGPEGEVSEYDVDVLGVMERNKKVNDVFLQPGDTVVVPSAAPITVLGKIQQPQTFPAPQNASFTVRRAIAMAGGFTENANKHAVSLLRDGEVCKVNVSRLVGTADNVGEALGEKPLLPGDTIIVSAAQTVAVLGKVNAPTVFPLPENVPVTVTRSIAMAGGFKDIAKMNSVLHFRDGKVTKVNVSKILDQNSDRKLDIELKPGDIVYVSESRW